MKTYIDCIPCFIRQCLEATRNAISDEKDREWIVRDILRMMPDLDLNRPPPYIGQLIHRRLGELTGVKDPYRIAKRRFNQLAANALPELFADVRQSEDPLFAAAKLSIAANAIDMGVAESLTDNDVRAALRVCLDTAVLIADETAFRSSIESAKDILFLADNCGELAVDRLLIEAIGPKRVTLVVRGGPVLNDATLVDACDVKMHELVEIIDNGSDAPGTILTDCNDLFLERFHRADLIIAKGQGNFETLNDVEKNIFFLFKVKCKVISDHVGLPVGTHALLHHSRMRASALLKEPTDRL